MIAKQKAWVVVSYRVILTKIRGSKVITMHYGIQAVNASIPFLC